MRDNFEESVRYILPVCPYSQHKINTRSNTAHISDVTLRGRDRSRTGVEFRWHTKSEYAKLTHDQRTELWE